MKPVSQEPREHPPLIGGGETLVVVLLVVGSWFAWYLARERYHLTASQMLEFGGYIALGATGALSAIARAASSGDIPATECGGLPVRMRQSTAPSE